MPTRKEPLVQLRPSDEQRTIYSRSYRSYYLEPSVIVDDIHEVVLAALDAGTHNVRVELSLREDWALVITANNVEVVP